ncbi:MAG: hypothetical protein AAGB15_09005 [Pseudomonadota bacterium]
MLDLDALAVMDAGLTGEAPAAPYAPQPTPDAMADAMARCPHLAAMAAK